MREVSRFITLVLAATVVSLTAVAETQGDPANTLDPELAPTPPRTLSLRECLRIAIDENLDVMSQRATTAKATLEVSSARAAFLPAFSASSTYDDNEPDKRSTTLSVSQSTPWGTSLTLSGSRTTGTAEAGTTGSATLTQPLLRGIGLSDSMASLRMAHVNRGAAEARLERMLQDIVFRTKRQYYDAARLKETIKVRQQAVDRARLLLDEAAFKRSRGMVTVLDHANAVIQLADREATLVSTRMQLEDAFDDLKETLNLSLEEPLDVIPVTIDLEKEVTIDHVEGTVSVADRPGEEDAPAERQPEVIFRPVPRDYRTVVQKTLSSRPDLLAATYDLETRRLELDRKRNQKRHDLNLTASYTSTGAEDDPLFHLPEDQWSTGLTYNWPIGRIQRSNEYEKARLDLELQEIAVEKLTVAVRKGILRLFRRLKETELNILTYARKINAAAQALESAKIRKERGHTSFWEVTARESDLLDAQTSFINAYLNYQKQLAELDLECGTPAVDAVK